MEGLRPPKTMSERHMRLTGFPMTVVHAWSYRNEAPIELVDEQWESPELGLIIYACYSDSNGGVIEYRLTNIRRADPSPGLFVVPPDYTLDPGTGPEDPWYSSQDRFGGATYRAPRRQSRSAEERRP